MTESEMGIGGMIELAERRGKELQELEKRNRKRAAKGRPPLPDSNERADKQVRRIRQRAGVPLTVDGADAMKLYEKRKAEMIADAENSENSGSESAIDSYEREFDKELSEAQERKERQEHPERFNPSSPSAPSNPVAVNPEKMEKAIKEAAAARRVSDLKNGRINHQSVWEDDQQRLEGGDKTELPKNPSTLKKKTLSDNAEKLLDKSEEPKPSKSKGQKAKKEGKTNGSNGYLSYDDFKAFRDDLYYRLKESFGGLENSLSDLQGRVSEIVTASAAVAQPANGDPNAQSGLSEFEELMNKRMPVAFDVGGANISFDAITVFRTPPCITVVYKMSSAAIKLKPGARLKLSYEMEGKKYDNDPVTYLGTRFELPMLGLAFMSFIRDMEASQLDVDAGIAKDQQN